MKVLVTGRGGQVARAVVRRARARGVVVETLARPEFDLARPERVSEIFAARNPDVVVNAAAYTSVDRAESEEEAAFDINAHGAEAVARGAVAAGAVLLHVSTDFVFPGDKDAPYVETDATGPISVYGASKLEGERRVLAAHPKAIVLRTAWVFDAEGANFVRTMLRLARSHTTINVVSDQQGSPTFAPDLADALLDIGAKAMAGDGAAGIFHCAGGGGATRAEWAGEIFTQSGAHGGPSAVVASALSSDFPTPAKRPANSRLNCDKLADAYGVRLRPWREALAACMDDIAAGGWRVE